MPARLNSKASPPFFDTFAQVGPILGPVPLRLDLFSDLTGGANGRWR